MKITYTPNPLATVVELEPHERELLKLKLKLEIYEDKLFDAHWALTSRLKDISSLKALALEEAVAEARKELDPSKWIEDDSPIHARLEELTNHYVSELMMGHVGDCTAFPMSCSKCHAENLLGIDTLGPKSGKHVLYRIASVFSTWNPETQKHDRPEVSLDEALDKLKSDPNGKDAYEYLLNYRNTHFPKE